MKIGTPMESRSAARAPISTIRDPKIGFPAKLYLVIAIEKCLFYFSRETYRDGMYLCPSRKPTAEITPVSQDSFAPTWQRRYTVSQKNCAKLFLSELRQIFTDFDNFGKKMAKGLELCEVHSLSTSPNSRHYTTVLNADVTNCMLHNAESCYLQ